MTRGQRIVLEVLVSNLVPLCGVLSWDWSVLELILCYMAETWALQAIFLVRSLLAQGEGRAASRATKLAAAGRFIGVQGLLSGFYLLFI